MPPAADPKPPRAEPLRADAAQNRDRILEVARTAFAASPTASLNSIAKEAGVGAGTLYRHFPTREDLLLAVYERDVQRRVDSVADVLAAHPPLEALRIWFAGLADDIRVKHGLGDALNSAAAQAVIGATYAPVNAALAQLLEACEAAGEVRPGLEPMDVLLLMSCLWRVPEGAAGAEQQDRLFDLVVDGLRVRPGA